VRVVISVGGESLSGGPCLRQSGKGPAGWPGNEEEPACITQRADFWRL
jgi:hypothetical protein